MLLRIQHTQTQSLTVPPALTTRDSSYIIRRPKKVFKATRLYLPWLDLFSWLKAWRPRRAEPQKSRARPSSSHDEPSEAGIEGSSRSARGAGGEMHKLNLSYTNTIYHKGSTTLSGQGEVRRTISNHDAPTLWKKTRRINLAPRAQDTRRQAKTQKKRCRPCPESITYHTEEVKDVTHTRSTANGSDTSHRTVEVESIVKHSGDEGSCTFQ